MSRIVDDKEFFTVDEAKDYLGISRNTFYRNVRKLLKEYNFDGKKIPFFSKAELDRFKRGEIQLEDGNKG